MSFHNLSIDLIFNIFARNNYRWLRILIIIGLVLLSMALTFLVPQRYMILIPAMLLGIAGILLFMKWPPLGLLAVIGTMIIPINGPSNSNATLALVGILFALWLLDMFVRRRQIKLMESPAIKPLIGLMIVSALSFTIGQLPWFAFAQHAPLGAQLAGLSIFFLSASIFILTSHQISDIRWLKYITWTFLLIGGVFLLGRWLPVLGQITSFLYGEQVLGSMFWTWVVAMAFSQAIFNKSLHPVIRGLFFCITLATTYISFFIYQGWKSGWVPPLITIATLIGLRFLRLALLLILPVIGLLPSIISDIIDTDQYSFSTRLDAWKILVDIIKVNPIFGLGPANYFWYTPLFSIRGYYVRFNSHNQYFDIIAQTGLLGLACILWFFWEVFRLGWRMRIKAQTGFSQAYVYGVLGGLAGTIVAGMLGDWILPFFYNVTLGGFRASMLPWLFFGGLVAIERINLDENKIHSTTES